MSEQLYDDWPILTLEVGFTSEIGDVPFFFTDLTDRLRGGSIRRGRQRDLDQFEAATMTVRLDNSDRALDPSFFPVPVLVDALPILLYDFRLVADFPVVHDLSRSNHEASLNGGYANAAGPTPLSSSYAPSIDLNGTTGYVNIPDVGLLNVTNNFSIEAWVKPDALAALQTIYSRDKSGADDPQLSITTGGEIRYDGGATVISSGAGISAGNWKHVCITFDNARTPKLKMFANGVLVGSGNPTAPASTTGPAYLGKSGAGEFFDGKLALFAMFSRTLHDLEVAEHYQAGIAGSAYYPNVVPNRRIRLSAVWNSVTYRLFDGFVDGWPQTWPDGAGVYTDSIVEIIATSAEKIFGSLDLPATPWELEVISAAPRVWYRLNEVGDDSTPLAQDGNYLAAEAIRQEHGEYIPTATPGQDSFIPFDGGRGVQIPVTSSKAKVKLPAAAVISTDPFTIEAVIRTDISGDSRYVFDQQYAGARVLIKSDGIVKFTSGPAANDVAESTVAVNDGNTHHIACVRDASGGTTVKVYVDGVDVTTYPSGTPAATADHSPGNEAYIGSLGTSIAGPTTFFIIDELIIYDYALLAIGASNHASAALSAWDGDSTDERLQRILDYIFYPYTDLDAGSSILGGSELGGTALEYMNRIQETERGFMFVNGAGELRFISRHAMFAAPYTTVQAVFGDDPNQSELPYSVDPEPVFQYDDVNIINIVTVDRAGGNPQVAEDAASQARYTKRGFGFQGMHRTDLEANDAAHYIVNNQKDPQFDVTALSIKGRSSPTLLWPKALGLEIADLVTVKRRPPGGGAPITRHVRLQGISHDFDVNGEWTTTFQIYRADLSKYWLLGVTGSSELGETTRLGY